MSSGVSWKDRNFIKYECVVTLIFLLTSLTLKAAPHPENLRKTVSLTYTVTLERPKQAFEKVRVWIPRPNEEVDQKLLGTQIDSPVAYRLTQEPRYSNRMIFLELDASVTFPIVLRATYKLERTTSLTQRFGSKELSWNPINYLKAEVQTPLDGLIRKISDQESKGLSESAKIDALYDYVVRTMRYDKTGTGWGRGDAIWACTNKRGNCTDFHSLLIGLVRSQKIPGRFEIGLLIGEASSGEIPGYHCWARIFDQERGWIPVDASESKKSGEPRKYFGTLPPNRVHFTTGRDLTLEPPQSGAPLNYFIYPYAEVDARPYEELTTKFSYTTL